MKNKYYITSIGYNVLGEELNQTLCEYEGKKEFRQPHFERAWTQLTFDTEYIALIELRKIYPDRLLTLLEDTGKVISTFGYESGITSMRIKQENNL